MTARQVLSIPWGKISKRKVHKYRVPEICDYIKIVFTLMIIEELHTWKSYSFVFQLGMGNSQIPFTETLNVFRLFNGFTTILEGSNFLKCIL